MFKIKQLKVILSCILAISAIFPFLCSCESSKEESCSISSVDYGLVANDISAAKNNSSALKKMIKESKSNEKSEIVFPAGTYYFDTSDGSVRCEGAENITFVGNNTLFINSCYDNKNQDDYFSTCLMAISKCKNVKFKNIDFDYLDYTSLNGTVIARSDDKITVKPDSEFFTDTYHNAISGGELVYAVSEFSADGSKYVGDYYLPSPVALKVVKDTQNVELAGFKNSITVGNTVVFRFGLGEKIPSFIVSETEGFFMENVNIFSSPCAVVYSTDGSSNFGFDGLNVAPRKNSKMMFSANVDGVHLKNFSNLVTFKNCTFKGMGDDAFNTNSRAALVTSVDGKKVSVKSGYEAEEMPNKWAQKGDVLNVYNKKWEKLGQITVEKYSDGKIECKTNIDAGFKNCYLENTRYLPEIHIENTTVDLSRARGFMLRSKNITVKGCTVKNTALPAIIASPDISQWYEMSPCENVIITDCVFDNCATADWANGGVITFKYADDNLKTFATKIHKNVTVCNNSFTNHSIHALYAAGVDKLKIANNTIENQTNKIKTVNCENIDTDTP